MNYKTCFDFLTALYQALNDSDIKEKNSSIDYILNFISDQNEVFEEKK